MQDNANELNQTENEGIEQFPDGIYFEMDEKIYHGQKRMSSGGVRNMYVSPADFWADSWLNKLRNKDDEEESNALILGRAYHCARLEPQKFNDEYIREHEKSDYENLYSNMTQVGKRLEEFHGLAKKAGNSETALQQGLRLLEIEPDAKIWAVLDDQFKMLALGKTPIKAKYYDQLQLDLELLHKSKEVEHLKDGFAEVTILWTDERTGQKLKARIDYLKTDEFTDVKTFDNPLGKRVNRTIIEAVMYREYYIQQTFYNNAIDIARETDLPIRDPKPEYEEFISKLRANKNYMKCFFIFQQKSGVPNIFGIEWCLNGIVHPSHELQKVAAPDDEVEEMVAKKSTKISSLKMKANTIIDWALNQFDIYFETYGEDPWLPMDSSMRLTDEDFPPYFLESD